MVSQDEETAALLEWVVLACRRRLPTRPPAFTRPLWGAALALYQPGIDRLLVVRSRKATSAALMTSLVTAIVDHGRFLMFDVRNADVCRIQLDLITEAPRSFQLSALEIAMQPSTAGLVLPWTQDVGYFAPVATPPVEHFEAGVDGLRVSTPDDGMRRYLLPGDAFVFSLMSSGHIRRRIGQLFPDTAPATLVVERFRSRSFIDGPTGWLPAYRGMPSTPPPDDDAFATAACAGASWLLSQHRTDGSFTYYYDAASDSTVDHEHSRPSRNSAPYYNVLRHCGAVITLLLHEAHLTHRPTPEPDSEARTQSAGTPFAGTRTRPRMPWDSMKLSGPRHAIIRNACEWFCNTVVTYGEGRCSPAGFSTCNNKGKLGASGIGLFMLMLYRDMFGDGQFDSTAHQLARHLLNEIGSDGEFRYYRTYLGREVSWSENRAMFSFYYPGEALLGLAAYAAWMDDGRDRIPTDMVYESCHRALHFLLETRPRVYSHHYQALPADSWLMMAILFLWDVPEFRRDLYVRFVFGDADAMCDHMYDSSAPYPDYHGAFFYTFGDHPYPDGARAEGLLAAWFLARRCGDGARSQRYANAVRAVSKSLHKLCNTRESTYSCRDRGRAIGGIRFKYTRQWFRIDTIQHVACFYFKMLLSGTHAPRWSVPP